MHRRKMMPQKAVYEYVCECGYREVHARNNRIQWHFGCPLEGKLCGKHRMEFSRIVGAQRFERRNSVSGS